MSHDNQSHCLIVFVTTQIADTYVNAISHTVKYLGVQQVELVVISEHGYPKEPDWEDWGHRILESLPATRSISSRLLHIRKSKRKKMYRQQKYLSKIKQTLNSMDVYLVKLTLEAFLQK